MITKEEGRELLSVLNFYMMGGLLMGLSCATVAAYGGIVFVGPDYGLPVPPKAITITVVMLMCATLGVLAYLFLLPAELGLIRIKLKPRLLARKLSRRR